MSAFKSAWRELLRRLTPASTNSGICYGDARFGTDVTLQFRPTLELANYLQRMFHVDFALPVEAVTRRKYSHVSMLYAKLIMTVLTPLCLLLAAAQ